MNPEGKTRTPIQQVPTCFSQDPLMLLWARPEWRSRKLQMTCGETFDLAYTIEHVQYCSLYAGMF